MSCERRRVRGVDQRTATTGSCSATATRPPGNHVLSLASTPLSVRTCTASPHSSVSVTRTCTFHPRSWKVSCGPAAWLQTSTCNSTDRRNLGDSHSRTRQQDCLQPMGGVAASCIGNEPKVLKHAQAYVPKVCIRACKGGETTSMHFQRRPEAIAVRSNIPHSQQRIPTLGCKHLALIYATIQVPMLQHHERVTCRYHYSPHRITHTTHLPHLHIKKPLMRATLCTARN